MSGRRLAMGRIRIPILVASCALAAVLATLALYAYPGDEGARSNAMGSISSIDYAPILESLGGTNHPIPADIASANNRFAIDFYREVAGDDDNIFFSPLSMYTIFSALYEGARGDTAAQLEDVFGFEPDPARRADSTIRMMSSINRDDPDAVLALANGMWPFVQLRSDYADILGDIYGVENIPDLPLEGDVLDRINGWTSQRTHGKITKILDALPPNPVLVLINAIYFKGTWENQFDPGQTSEFDFMTDPGTGVPADFMTTQARFGYAETGGAQVLRMPYVGDRLSMLLILPERGTEITDLEERLSEDLLSEWTGGMQGTEVTVLMPKFETRTDYDLDMLLPKMGLTDVFIEGSANLTGIYDVGKAVWVSEAAQKAYVKVNESGTEAAAVTSVTFAMESANYPPVFLADRPFMFLIQDDESGAILFMGRVSDPSPQP